MRQSPALTKHDNSLLLIAFIFLLLVSAGLFASAIHFGMMWDDPEWYARGIGKSLLALVKPSTDYQFYRPGLMLFNRLFVKTDGTFAMPVLHLTQISWYLINLTVIFAISQRVGFVRWAAFMVALLTAFHPFVYQAVAWAAPGQPLTAVFANLALLLYLLGRHRSAANPARPPLLIASITTFVIAISVHEASVAFAVMPLLFEATLRLQTNSWQTIVKSWRHPWQERWAWPSLYVGVAFLFLLIWFLIPKESGITGSFWDPRVFTYLLQGFVLLFADSQLTKFMINESTLVIFWGLLVLLLWCLSLYKKRGILATLGLIWTILGIAPILISLPFSYVSIASRLFYSSIPGVSWLWVCALWPTEKNRSFITAVFSISALLIITLFGLVTNISFKHLYTTGITHLNDMSLTLTEKDGSYLFINFPDRYRLKEEPLTLGYWGVTLAPVVVDLAEFPALLDGSQAQTHSRSMPWIDEENRANGPYQVNMRGVIIQPEELVQLAREQDGVYITRYDIAGNFDLQYAGALETWHGGECGTAVFDNTICLQDVQLILTVDSLRLRTTWWTQEPLPPHLTLFTHLQQPGSPLLAQADGDTWQGILPLTNWQPGDLIVDERELPLPPNDTDWFISIGVYNWVNKERLAGVDNEERPLPNSTYIIPSPP